MAKYYWRTFAFTIVILAGGIHVSHPAFAQPELSTQAGLSTDCDTYAASDQDPQRNSNSDGVSFDKINPALAVPACEAAVQQYPNDDRLIYQLGRAYQKANNFAAAVVEYRKAAEHGYIMAQTNLGVMYENGQGVPQDYAQAAQLFRDAAEQGLATAQFNLGTMYDTGQGLRQDSVQALSWYRKAADQGIASAQFNLGVMYETGRGVVKDRQQAMMWYQKAADQGFSAARHRLSELLTQDTPVTLEDAKTDLRRGNYQIAEQKFRHVLDANELRVPSLGW